MEKKNEGVVGKEGSGYRINILCVVMSRAVTRIMRVS